ncbi:GH1 family beta-glucosidase [Clostridium estertheticum]|uniref:Beta-glucosidase n=1 Tax=Clostridium estertheticum subsp. estertheticum TaxID=1552 RepID=A0A1J0GEF5_9CLOT|nr:GH1 family beta-glucosidase [Clostridium estertheticum]APC39754.1 beta-glucosidase [Clostridium estertheticum subsp. estertheticum]MBU3172087.1 beta-glucosidase [Clostridium estertheticum]MBZ9614201.1 beta-glucosidase [Clostridium estertheticum subsp. laramiense]WAG74146.1 beta-glucosidase [Clostridium estertheticum]
MNKFEDDFILGTATAAYQIEGGVNEGGRMPSIWDTFSKKEENVFMGHTGDIACDHYHRVKEDVKILDNIGVDSYRFSISWSRIFPCKDEFNPEGVKFYKNLINELKDKKIAPAITLYHWDLPQWAQDLGGWENRDCIYWFEDYCTRIFEEFGQDVSMWITHNEPFCASILGNYLGMHAPGNKDLKKALIVAHHLLLSHGIVVRAFKKFKFENSKIGITLNLSPTYAVSMKKEDVIAAKISDGYNNRWFLDPLLKGHYPEDMVDLYEKEVGVLDFILEGDLNIISTDMDFLGINYYTRSIVEYDGHSQLKFRGVDGEKEKTAMGWENSPESMHDLLTRIKQEYTKLPLYITENGAAYDDVVTGDNKIHDIDRINFIKVHLKVIQEFIKEGGNLKGYYLWSFMDNFEWSYGYSKRFGMVYVNYNTQERIMKDSAIWYKKIIKARSLEV